MAGREEYGAAVADGSQKNGINGNNIIAILQTVEPHSIYMYSTGYLEAMHTTCVTSRHNLILRDQLRYKSNKFNISSNQFKSLV